MRDKIRLKANKQLSNQFCSRQQEIPTSQSCHSLLQKYKSYLPITKNFDNISRRRRQKCQIIISNTVSSHEYYCIKVMKVIKKLQDQL